MPIIFKYQIRSFSLDPATSCEFVANALCYIFDYSYCKYTLNYHDIYINLFFNNFFYTKILKINILNGNLRII